MNKFNKRYSTSEWNDYAELHASVTTTLQLSVYNEASNYLTGNVIDCGCGTAKIAPFLAEKKNILSYTGIDYSKSMVNIARGIVNTLQNPSFKIKQSRIEKFNGIFTSGISIQSYYSWDNPLIVLKNIFDILEKNSIFVLATPNPNINLKNLIKHARKELIYHPNFNNFQRYNLHLSKNLQANFIKLDDLIKQVQKVGFRIIKCHQEHFLGGLNFLVLHKD